MWKLKIKHFFFCCTLSHKLHSATARAAECTHIALKVTGWWAKFNLKETDKQKYIRTLFCGWLTWSLIIYQIFYSRVKMCHNEMNVWCSKRHKYLLLQKERNQNRNSSDEDDFHISAFILLLWLRVLHASIFLQNNKQWKRHVTGSDYSSCS